MKRGWLVGAVAVTLLSAAGAWAAPAMGELRPEWSVGQELASPDSLAVTPPIPAPASLTLQEAVDTALNRNTGFRQTVSGLLSARDGLEVARKRWDLNLTGASTRDQDAGLSTTAGAALSYALFSGANFSVSSELNQLVSDESQDSLSATLRQPLLSGWGAASSSYESVRAARNGYRRALLDYFVSRQSLIVGVIGAYFSVVQQREAVKIQAESVARAEQTVKETEVRLQEGMIIEMDLLNAQQQLASAQAQQVQAEESYQQAMDQLMLQLGLEIGGKPELVSEVEYRPEDQDLGKATEQALELRPELYLAQLGIEDSQAGVRLARSRRLPSLDLLGGLTRFATGGSNNLWNLGLAATVPLGARDLEQGYRQSQWSLLLAQQSLEDTRQRVIADIRSQVRAAEAARRQVDLAEQGVKIAERSVVQAKRLVEEDLRTNRDLLEAQRSLRDSKLGLSSSKINYFMAVMRLKVAMGQDVATALPLGAAPPTSPTSPAPAPEKSKG